jgi:hypothetical protein
MRFQRAHVLFLALASSACAQADGDDAITSPAFAVEGGVVASVNGGGHYQLPGLLIQFSTSGVVHADGGVSGSFHHSTNADGALIEFHGTVTCLPVDPLNHRAWVGGVITENLSTHPDFMGGIFDPGHDIWFRMVDYGQGHDAPPDRTTFVGFEGSAGIQTSEEYCALQIWPDEDARTWPITGNIKVSP